MYANHNPVIANAMRADPDTFVRGATFAVLSIRQKIFNLAAQMDDVDEYRSESPYLFGHKRNAYRYLNENVHRLHPALCRLDDPEPALRLMTETPGLGIVKGAFVAQLMGFDVGCLDSRNLARLGMSPRAHQFRLDDVGQGTRHRRITRYVTEYGGRSQELWDAWCIDVANAYPNAYTDADAVSAAHLVIVPGDFIPF